MRIKSIKRDLNRLKNVKLKNILAVFPLLLSVMLLPFFKKKYQDMWVISDREDEAQDNGFFFFCYMCKEHPSIPCVYAIRKSSRDYNKVAAIGKTVEFGSLKHWIMYLAGRYNISSIDGQPDSYLCTFLERVMKRQHNVFLQHGITINNPPWLHSDRHNYEFLFTGAVQERDYIIEELGYDEQCVRYTGFARFDNLHSSQTNQKLILIMPTWRSWLKKKADQQEGEKTPFEKTEYFLSWQSFINSPYLETVLREEDCHAVFFPHSNMQEYVPLFSCTNKRVTIASKQKYNVQELMKESAMMITDYSSVFFDMIYMKKPVVFFQFDLEAFRSNHYKEGWFSYDNNAFTSSIQDQDAAIQMTADLIHNGYALSDEFLEGHKQTFPLYDTKNSERIYSILAENA